MKNEECIEVGFSEIVIQVKAIAFKYVIFFNIHKY